MSEKDIQLKNLVRKIFWYEGLSSRLNVKLSALIPRDMSRTRAPLEEYTDLDVLGIVFAPDFRLRLKIADCKTSPKRIPERLFWLEGVKRFFRADECYLVRPYEVTSSSKQLAARLGISLICGNDLDVLTQIVSNASETISDSPFLSGSSYHEREQILNSLEEKLQPLQTYRLLYYWLFEPNRNLQQLISFLGDFRPHLHADLKPHLMLFSDYVWLYTLTTLQTVEYIATAGISNINHSMRQYLFGGELALRERELLVKQLKELRSIIEGKEAHSARDMFSVLPPYYDDLLELVTRFIRKPRASGKALRYAEWLNLSAAFLSQPSDLPPELVPIDEISVKLLNDVAIFIAKASGLDKSFSDKYIELSNQVFSK